MSAKIVKPRRFEMVLEIKGRVWRRVTVEVSPDEGLAGLSQESYVAPDLSGFGLPTPNRLVGIAMSYQIAQKMHAVSDPHKPPEFVNNRARGIVDLVLLKHLAHETGLPSDIDIIAAVQDIFEARAREAELLGRPKKTWPVKIRAYGHWEGDYASASLSAKLDMSMVDAIAEINEWIAELAKL